jgi:hypothetical protein
VNFTSIVVATEEIDPYFSNTTSAMLVLVGSIHVGR